MAAEEEEEEKEGFRVQDRRIFTPEGERRPGSEETRPQPEEAPRRESARETRPRQPPPSREPLPEIDFVTFLLSLGSQALVHLGDIPDPATRKKEKNLELAKQTIDLLEILRQKTGGNLTPEEDDVLQNLLADLRMRYVAAAR